MLEFSATPIEGVLRLEPRRFHDRRGDFIKLFSSSAFRVQGLASEWKEFFISRSVQNVIRGLHFQAPPHDHEKLVCCLEGSTFDVAMDLRNGSPTYGHAIHLSLGRSNSTLVYLPRGVAHGFCVQSDHALMAYAVSTEHAPEHDLGVHYSSAAVPWPTRSPILSERDKAFPRLEDFTSPFEYR